MDISNVRNEVGEFGYIFPCESVQSILSKDHRHAFSCAAFLSDVGPNSPPASKNVAAAVVASTTCNIEV